MMIYFMPEKKQLPVQGHTDIHGGSSARVEEARVQPKMLDL